MLGTQRPHDCWGKGANIAGWFARITRVNYLQCWNDTGIIIREESMMSADPGVLIPTEERRVKFYDDEIVATVVAGDVQPEIYVPLRPICDHLGLSWNGQRERIRRDPVLADALRVVRMPQVSSTGGDPELLCLPLHLLPGWLFGISATRVKPDLQEKVTRYRRDCFRVLWRAFQDDALQAAGHTALVSDSPRTSTSSTSLEQIRQMGLAVAQLAEQQMVIEQQVTTHETRIDRAAVIIRELQRRIGAVEDRLEPGTPISDAQAADIAGHVKALGELLTIRQGGKNYYQAIFAELYRRFGVSSYKLIPIDSFGAVVQFLVEWRMSVEHSPTQS